jgi:uncharacterized protein (TIGR00251 family)
MERLPLAPVPGGVTVAVRLTPRGGRDALDGVAAGADGRPVLRARVSAPPADGEANAALLALLARAFGVARRDLAIEAGAASRAKRVRVTGDPAALAAALARALEAAGRRP